ncbi:MAG: AAA family ATPase [Coleofasciculus chthonoplastes F3-SA18-01]|uniref:GumC family protein n=1 Tax=Coleofasciculus chthonoplastes TaxID=64178 RepID=UPI0033052A05
MTIPLIKRYLIALDRYKFIGIGVFALITGGAGVVAIMPSPPSAVSYEGWGDLAVTTPAKVFSTTGGEIQQQGLQRLTEQNLLAENVIKATAIAVGSNPKEIIENLEWKSDNSGKDGEASIPSIIRVIYTDDDPEQAIKTVEVLMQKMIEQSRLINSERLQAIIDSIETRSAEAENELKQAQEELETFNRIEGAALALAEDNSLLAQISGNQQQQRQVQQTLEGIESQMASLQRRLGLTADQAYTNSALSADPTIAGLRGQLQQIETQIKLLKSQGYRDQHPNLEELQRQQRTYEAMLGKRAAEVIEGNGLGEALTPSRIRIGSSLDPTRQQLANQLVSLSTQRDTLRDQLETTNRIGQELLQEYQQIPTKQLEQVRLAQKFQIKQDFYNTLQASLIDAKAADAETVSYLSVSQTPGVQQKGGKESTNPIVILAGGTFVGLIAAAGVILILAILDSKLYAAKEIQQLLAQHDVPVLAELPVVMSIDPDLGQTGILLKSSSPYLEVYERFRSKLCSGEHKSLKVVLIASTVKGEGKSTTAYNLAIASAHAGKRTLLIEADLRSPSQAHFHHVTPEPEAKTQPLPYYGSKSACIQLAPNIQNLYIVPSPGPQKQAAAILESREFQQLITDARNRFDFVVIDSPALSLSNDTLLLEPLADGMVLVTRPGYSEKSILNLAAQELTETEPSPLLGAIINGADTSIPVNATEVEEDIELEYEDEDEDAFEDEELEEEQEEPIPTGATRS